MVKEGPIHKETRKLKRMQSWLDFVLFLGAVLIATGGLYFALNYFDATRSPKTKNSKKAAVDAEVTTQEATQKSPQLKWNSEESFWKNYPVASERFNPTVPESTDAAEEDPVEESISVVDSKDSSGYIDTVPAVSDVDENGIVSSILVESESEPETFEIMSAIEDETADGVEDSEPDDLIAEGDSVKSNDFEMIESSGIV